MAQLLPRKREFFFRKKVESLLIKLKYILHWHLSWTDTQQCLAQFSFARVNDRSKRTKFTYNISYVTTKYCEASLKRTLNNAWHSVCSAYVSVHWNKSKYIYNTSNFKNICSGTSPERTRANPSTIFFRPRKKAKDFRK